MRWTLVALAAIWLLLSLAAAWIESILPFASGAPPVRLISAEQEIELRAMLPPVEDRATRALLRGDDLVWYTDTELPPAYQFQDTFHSPAFNIADPSENDPFGNGNREFPWKVAAGTDNVKELKAYRFFRLPKKDDGGYWPIVYFRAKNPGVRSQNDGRIRAGEAGGPDSQWQWIFPRGTTVGELLCIPDASGERVYPFEIRLRFREADHWDIDAYRPFPTAESLSRRIKELRPGWRSDAELVALVEQLDTPRNFKTLRLIDDSPRITAFDSGNRGVHPLPPIKDDEFVAELLTTSLWRGAAGQIWAKGANGVTVTSPTVNEGTGFHIVPERYQAWAFSVDGESCMNCHKHTLTAVREFSFNRGWYGSIRGSDGIFSVNPVAPVSVSPNGQNIQVTWRQDFVDAGILEAFNEAEHPEEYYKRVGLFVVK